MEVVGTRDPVRRALAVLEMLARQGGDLGVTEIGNLVRLNKSTVYRLLQSMAAAGFVNHGKIPGTYRASAKLFELGNLVLERVEMRQEAAEQIRKLENEVEETVHLVVRDGCHGVYIDKVESTQTILLRSYIGRRIPLYCTAVGKVLLAGLDPESRRETLLQSLAAYESRRFTPNTLVDPLILDMVLERVRADGYALDREENEPGVICAAAPIRDHSGEVVAACSISAPAFRVSEERLERLISAVVAATDGISHSLGYADPGVAGK